MDFRHQQGARRNGVNFSDSALARASSGKKVGVYSERVKQLVAELRFSGRLKNPTHVGESSNPICGDVTRFELNVLNDRVTGCRFLATGCVAAIAAAAALARLCQNQPVQTCLAITSKDLLADLDPLPRHKLHAIQLALDALHKALRKPHGVSDLIYPAP